jgi:hypothetical protein
MLTSAVTLLAVILFMPVIKVIHCFDSSKALCPSSLKMIMDYLNEGDFFGEVAALWDALVKWWDVY